MKILYEFNSTNYEIMLASIDISYKVFLLNRLTWLLSEFSFKEISDAKKLYDAFKSIAEIFSDQPN